MFTLQIAYMNMTMNMNMKMNMDMKMDMNMKINMYLRMLYILYIYIYIYCVNTYYVPAFPVFPYLSPEAITEFVLLPHEWHVLVFLLSSSRLTSSFLADYKLSRFAPWKYLSCHQVEKLGFGSDIFDFCQTSCELHSLA